MQTTTLRAESHHPPIVLEGNGSRPSHKGNGYKESETCYTLNQVDRHAVCYRKVRRAQSKDDFETWQHSSISNTLNCFDVGDVRSTTIIIEHHPNDSRTKIADDQKNCQGLTSRMGTGGGNVPLILQEDKS